MKTPKASVALRQAPDPMPIKACFSHTTPTTVGVPPLNPILDPLQDLSLYSNDLW